VQIHHSRDLVHWELLPHPLNRHTQLDMRGDVNSGGVWAPCLSYEDGLYYLIFTDVKSRKGAFKDTHNYLVTADDIRGPWSEPVYLNSSGFDPSLFHDDDGRKWLINMVWDHRKGRNRFGGIVLQEYDAAERKLTGPARTIFEGTELGFTEGPHLYKYNGYYYLLTAEGGTKYDHAVTVARSRDLFGPYESDPANPILTSAGRPELELQKAGHGSLVETATGEWYMAHLCGRPAAEHYCTLGRETALQRVSWNEEGWLRLEGGGRSPQVTVQAPRLPEFPFEPGAERDDFDHLKLRTEWSTLRIPPEDFWLSLTEREGFLRIHGMESLSSLHRQSMVARRQQSFRFEAETALEFEPVHFQQAAGLILFYDTDDYVYLRKTCLDDGSTILGIVQSVGGQYDELTDYDVGLKEGGRVLLKAEVDRVTLQFRYSPDNGESWHSIGSELDIRHLSDDFTEPVRFTGTFVGMCVQDLSGNRRHADFDYFIYKEITG
jgi:xylan 1,4-beta-xylosidase